MLLKGLIRLLFNKDFYINSLFCTYREKPKNHKFINNLPRKSYVLVFVQKGNLKFISPTGTVFATDGDLVLIPQNMICSTEFLAEKNLAFNFFFTLTEYKKIDELLHFSINTEIHKILQNVITEYKKGYTCNTYILSELYKLLYILNKNNVQDEKYKKISPAIDYITLNFKETVPVSVYAKMCAMSETSFRKLFKELMGQKPTEFRTNLRLKHVEELALEGTPITEAILEAGFGSPSFYYRIKRKNI